ncbi:hypothetical protein D3C80_836040 [compost metagenome]
MFYFVFACNYYSTMQTNTITRIKLHYIKFKNYESKNKMYWDNTANSPFLSHGTACRKQKCLSCSSDPHNWNDRRRIRYKNKHSEFQRNPFRPTSHRRFTLESPTTGYQLERRKTNQKIWTKTHPIQCFWRYGF